MGDRTDIMQKAIIHVPCRHLLSQLRTDSPTHTWGGMHSDIKKGKEERTGGSIESTKGIGSIGN